MRLPAPMLPKSRGLGIVGHASPLSGLPEDRVRKAGYSPETVGENLVRARSIESAQHQLMQSPAHRDNILSPEVGRVGVGVALRTTKAGQELFVTQIFLPASKAISRR